MKLLGTHRGDTRFSHFTYPRTRELARQLQTWSNKSPVVREWTQADAKGVPDGANVLAYSGGLDARAIPWLAEA